jgi:hypothetical protein
LDSVNWPMWIMAFSALIVSIALVSVLISFALVLRKIGAVTDALGFAVSQTGSLLKKRLTRSDADEFRPAGGKKSMFRGLKAVATVIGALARFIGRKKRP